MNNTWLKIKVWTKIIVFALIAVVTVIVLAQNWPTRVKISLLSKEYEWSLLLVLFFTCIFSIFGWWLFKTALKTVRQIRDVRRKAHLERIEKEHSEMLAKAAKLQTRPETLTG